MEFAFSVIMLAVRKEVFIIWKKLYRASSLQFSRDVSHRGIDRVFTATSALDLCECTVWIWRTRHNLLQCSQNKEMFLLSKYWCLTATTNVTESGKSCGFVWIIDANFTVSWSVHVEVFGCQNLCWRCWNCKRTQLLNHTINKTLNITSNRHKISDGAIQCSRSRSTYNTQNNMS